MPLGFCFFAKIQKCLGPASLPVYGSLQQSSSFCRFSQQSVNFCKNLQIFAEICKLSQTFASCHANLQIFAEKIIFSQKSANFRCKKTDFRKNLQVFAKTCKFSPESANSIFEFSGSQPTSLFKNQKIFELSRTRPKPNRETQFFAKSWIFT